MTFCASWNPSGKLDASDKMQELQERRMGKGNASSWPVGRIVILNPSEGNGKNEGCSFG
jgi:hypothetical protein